MRNQVSKQRKEYKAKKRRADYVLRHNINANIPTIEVEQKKPRFRPVFDEIQHHYGVQRVPRIDKEGKPVLEHAGYKTVIVKHLNPIFKEAGTKHTPRKDAFNREVGMIAYPVPRKYRNYGRSKNTIISGDSFNSD